MDKALMWIIALGMLLPTMHQSSLGSIMMLTGDKLHPVWQTPLLPLLFLVSCITMGYAMVVFESLMSSNLLGRKAETPMLAGLWKAAAYTGIAWVIVRLIDVAWRGAIGTMGLNLLTVVFLLELALMIWPAVLYFRTDNHENRGLLFQSALLFIAGGTLYRFASYLIAFNPGQQWSYFPTLPEMFITIGMISFEIFVYIAIIKRFPILSGTTEPTPAPAH
jgi:Ni/Fe-hydrogenase subunit HybB-like protein